LTIITSSCVLTFWLNNHHKLPLARLLPPSPFLPLVLSHQHQRNQASWYRFGSFVISNRIPLDGKYLLFDVWHPSSAASSRVSVWYFFCLSRDRIRSLDLSLLPSSARVVYRFTETVPRLFIAPTKFLGPGPFRIRLPEPTFHLLLTGSGGGIARTLSLLTSSNQLWTSNRGHGLPRYRNFARTSAAASLV
jgi:hypothetical protein